MFGWGALKHGVLKSVIKKNYLEINQQFVRVCTFLGSGSLPYCLQCLCIQCSLSSKMNARLSPFT